MDEEQEAARRFIGEILRITGWTATGLAKRADVAHTTLTRLMARTGDTTLSARTLRKVRIAARTAIPTEQLDMLWLISQRTPTSSARQRRRV